jgi:hypothetical protein
MIRQRVQTTFIQDTPFGKLPKAWPSIVFEIGKESFEEIRDPMLSELQFYPPKLPNQKYIRTYKLKQGWKVGYSKINANTFAVTVSNDTDYTSFVVGSLDINLSEAVKFQASIHRNRWPLASKTVGTRFDDFVQRLDEKLNDKLSTIGTVIVKSRPKIRGL